MSSDARSSITYNNHFMQRAAASLINGPGRTALGDGCPPRLAAMDRRTSRLAAVSVAEPPRRNHQGRAGQTTRTQPTLIQKLMPLLAQRVLILLNRPTLGRELERAELAPLGESEIGSRHLRQERIAKV